MRGCRRLAYHWLTLVRSAFLFQEMRVGLHSGSTTAGVLRGDKGRFQLFGDTVNTASRMESNGVRGRIHVSQATADALTVAGKASWLTPRDDKIEAKGKGLMQTYWVATSSGPSNKSSDDNSSAGDLLTEEEDISGRRVKSRNADSASFGLCRPHLKPQNQQ